MPSRMLSRAQLPQTVEAARTFYTRFLTAVADGGGEEDLWHAERWLARNDLFYLLTVICGRKDMAVQWLLDRIREVETEPNGYLDLWAREHYKSTIGTFGLNIQDILASHGDDPEERYGGREVTIGIFSHTRGLAKDFLSPIKMELENNDRLKALFPDVLWEKPSQAPRWGLDTGLVVKRKTNVKEATVEAWGLVDGQPTGKHFFICDYDDVVTLESVNTPEQIQKATYAWSMSLNLGTEGGWRRYKGTRYHEFDSYQEIMDREAAVPRIYACTSDGSEDFSKSVLKSEEELSEKRKAMGQRVFATQMLLDPKGASTAGFKMEWLRFWIPKNWQRLNRYIVVDPSSGKRKDRDNDYTAMWVIGVGGDGKWRVLDMVRDRLNLPERIRMLFALHKKWKPIRVGYEDVGMQADVQAIEWLMEHENYDFEVVSLPANDPKGVRIARLEPVFERGDIFLPEELLKTNKAGEMQDLVKVFIKEEYRAYPVVKHEDMLDGLAKMTDEEMNIEPPIEDSVPDEHDPYAMGGGTAMSGSWMGQ